MVGFEFTCFSWGLLLEKSVFSKFSVSGNSIVITCRRGTAFSSAAIKTFLHSKEVTALKLEGPTINKLTAKKFTNKSISWEKHSFANVSEKLDTTKPTCQAMLQRNYGQKKTWQSFWLNLAVKNAQIARGNETSSVNYEKNNQLKQRRKKMRSERSIHC